MIDEACSGKSGGRIYMDNSPRAIGERILGIDEKKYIFNYHDPKHIIYYMSLSPLEGYSWDRYANGGTDVADFGINGYSKGMFIEGLSEKLEEKASGLGYPERIAVNVFSGEKGILVFRNVLADNGIVSYSDGKMLINTTHPYAYLWKYFHCGGDVCIKRGNAVVSYRMRCSLVPYVMNQAGGVEKTFSIESPCKAKISAEKGICRCRLMRVPVIRYDAEKDMGFVESVKELCEPMRGGNDAIPCIKVKFTDRYGCFPEGVSRCERILFIYDESNNYYDLNMEIAPNLGYPYKQCKYLWEHELVWKIK